MGCIHSTPAREDPETIHVPFGHVPYTPSLPGVMGPLWHFPIDWWFYGGWASDAANSKQFTIVLHSQRVVIDGCFFYGIGVKNCSSTSETAFVTKTDLLALGLFPTPASTSLSTKIETTHSSVTCKLTSGTLGLRGATYQVDMNDTTNNIQVSLNLESTVGLVQEGPACIYPGTDTIQFNMPAMIILKGSTITMNGETTQLAKGNIWLDRQSVKLFNIFKPLYIGSWLAITMNDRTSYTIQFVWPKREKIGTQWIVGTDVGYHPTAQTALEYPSLQNWEGSLPIQGVNVLKKEEFDLNILNPSDPENSPHWKSKKGNTYCTAWHLKLKDKVYKMVALVPDCEVWLDTYFFEGSAALYDENEAEAVGHAFVEQMGYN